MAGFFLFSNPNVENREVAHKCLSQILLDDYGPLQDFKLSTGIPSLGWGDKVFEDYQWDGTPNSGPPLAILLWVATETVEKLDRQMAELFPLTDRLDKPLCKPWGLCEQKLNNRFNQMNNALLDVEKQQFRDQCHWQWEFLHNIAHMDVHVGDVVEIFPLLVVLVPELLFLHIQQSIVHLIEPVIWFLYIDSWFAKGLVKSVHQREKFSHSSVKLLHSFCGYPQQYC